MADLVPNAVNPPIKTLLTETHTTDKAVQASADQRKLPPHTHTIAQVTGLQTALDGKQDKA
ncbi:tail fiber protein [Salmonella phage PMBT28]|nr:tail fiber protein [Salmonella phage PMBT28]